MHRGTATAFPLAMFGLSAFVFTAIANLAFGDSTGQYLLLLAVGTTTLLLLSTLFLRLIPTSPQHMSVGNTQSGFSLQEVNRLQSRSPAANGSRAKPGQCYLNPLHIVGRVVNGPIDDDSSEHEALMSQASDGDDIASRHSNDHSHVEVTGLSLLKIPKFWELFAVLGLLSGVGIMTIK